VAENAQFTRNYLNDYGDKVVFMFVTSEEPTKSKKFFKKKEFYIYQFTTQIPIHRKCLDPSCFTTTLYWLGDG